MDTDLKTLISRAFDRGNYANSYETTDLDTIDLDNMGPDERAAFVLGFYSSYALVEISEREEHDSAYHSPVGAYVVARGMIDSRDQEYASE